MLIAPFADCFIARTAAAANVRSMRVIGVDAVSSVVEYTTLSAAALKISEVATVA